MMLPAIKRQPILFIIPTMIVACIFIHASASGIMDRFEMANGYYRQGDYQKAIDAYRQLIADGYRFGEIYYNLGNAYYRLGDIGRAILNLERAKKFLPRDEDVRYNLELIRTLHFSNEDEAHKNLLTMILTNAYQFFSLNETASIVLGIYLSLCLLTIMYIFTRKDTARSIMKYIAVSLAFILLIFSISLYLKVKNEVLTEHAITIEKQVNLYSGPSEANEVIFQISEGSKVIIEKKMGEYYRVKNKELGYRGWVKSSDVEII